MQNSGVPLYTRQDCLLLLAQLPSVASNSNIIINQCVDFNALYKIIQRSSASTPLNGVSFKLAIDFINFLHPNNEGKIEDTLKAIIAVQAALSQFGGQFTSDDFLLFKRRLPQISLAESFTSYYLPLFKLGLLDLVDEIFARSDATDLISALRLLDENDLATDERVEEYLQLEEDLNLSLSARAAQLITRTRYRLGSVADAAAPALTPGAVPLRIRDLAPAAPAPLALAPVAAAVLPTPALAPAAAPEINLPEYDFTLSKKKLIAAGIWSDEMGMSIRNSPHHTELFLKLKKLNLFTEDAIKFANHFDTQYVDIFIKVLSERKMLTSPNLFLCLTNSLTTKVPNFTESRSSIINRIIKEVIGFNEISEVELTKLKRSPYDYIVNNKLYKIVKRDALLALKSHNMLQFQDIVMRQDHNVSGLVYILTRLPAELKTDRICNAIIEFGSKNKALATETFVTKILNFYSSGLSVSQIEQQHLPRLTKSTSRKSVNDYGEAVLGLSRNQNANAAGTYDKRALEFSVVLRKNYPGSVLQMN